MFKPCYDPSNFKDNKSKHSYSKECEIMWNKAVHELKSNPDKYLSNEIKDMFTKLSLNIKDVQIINSFDTQWQDNARVKNTVVGAYMEDVNLIALDEDIKKVFISQMLFSDGTMNREVAMVPSSSIIIQNMKTKTGKYVTLFSPEWVLVVSQLLFEQHCLQNNNTIDKATVEDKKVLKAIYLAITKHIIDYDLINSKMAVYINYDIMQQEENTDSIEAAVRQYVYGNGHAIVATSTGNNSSLNIMGNEQMKNSGITYTNGEGKTVMAALRFNHTSDKMSKAVDDALDVQAIQATQVEKEILEPDEKKRRIEPECGSAPFSSELPILDKDGNPIMFPFNAITTSKVVVKVTDLEDKNSGPRSDGATTKGASGGLTRGLGATRYKKNNDSVIPDCVAPDYNTTDINLDFASITITTCEKGKDICDMPIIEMKIPGNPRIAFQPGNIQVRVMVRSYCNPISYLKTDKDKIFTEADIKRHEEAVMDYLCNEIIHNMLKARIHLMNELKKVPNSHNITSLDKATFNHFDPKVHNKEFLKDSVNDLLANRFDPFKSIDFDIEALCNEAPAKTDTEAEKEIISETGNDSINAIDSINIKEELNPNYDSTVIKQDQEPYPCWQFVEWNEKGTDKAIVVSLGPNAYNIAYNTIQAHIMVKLHEDKYDETGKVIIQDKFTVFDQGDYREIIYTVTEDSLIKVNISFSHELTIIPVYVSSEGDEDPSEDFNMKVDEVYELPIPIEKDSNDEPDHWIIRDCQGKTLFKLTFSLLKN